MTKFKDEKTFLSVSNTVLRYKLLFTEAALRKLITNRHTNGLDKVVFKIGRKLVIDVDKFNNWIEGIKN